MFREIQSNKIIGYECGEMTGNKLAIINLDGIIGKTNAVKEKEKIIKYLNTLLTDKYKIIFWFKRATVKWTGILNGDTAFNKKLEVLKSLISKNFVLINMINYLAPPCMDIFLPYIANCKKILIVGKNIGNCTIIRNISQEITCNDDCDYLLYLNFTKFVRRNKEPSRKAFFKYLPDCFTEGETFIDYRVKFDPESFFELKKSIYLKYSYDVNMWTKPQIIYVVGAPFMGKTILAKSLAKSLNFNYVNKNTLHHHKTFTGGYIIDINPRVPGDYVITPDRIIIIMEPDLSYESQVELSRHLCLYTKRVLIEVKGDKKIQFDTHEVDNYFNVTDHFPNVIIDEVPYIPYQLFFELNVFDFEKIYYFH